MSRSRLSGRVGTALDPCAAMQVAFDLEDGEEREIVFTLGSGRMTMKQPVWPAASVTLLRQERRSKGCGATGTGRSAQSRWRHQTSLSISLQTAGSCTRPSPAVSGGEAATTSLAVHSASVTSYRIRWPSFTPSRACCGNTYFFAQAVSFQKAMSSTGGTHQ